MDHLIGKVSENEEKSNSIHSDSSAPSEFQYCFRDQEMGNYVVKGVSILIWKEMFPLLFHSHIKLNFKM